MSEPLDAPNTRIGIVRSNDRSLPWAIRHRYPRSKFLRSISWIWSNPITLALPSQMVNRRQDLRRLLDRLTQWL